ncbi:TPA: hypothetical protein QFQ19_000268 [Enterococcus faecium]
MKLKILNATFEQSLNLEDDLMVQFLYKDVKRQENEGVKEKPIIASSVYIILLFLIYGFYALADYLMKNPDTESLLGKANINYLPLPLFWISLVMFLLILSIIQSKRYNSIRFYTLFVGLNIYLMWLIVTVNLFLFTFFSVTMTKVGIFAFVVTLIAISFYLFKIKLTQNKCTTL